jgi:hypothetical protein
VASQEEVIKANLATARFLAVASALQGIPRGPKSKIFFVDPANGDDDNSGLSLSFPLATLAAAEDLCTANQHDVVIFVSGPTADSPEAAIVWDKSYTHLVGLSGDLPGVGQRCRVVNHADNDLAVLMTISGSGCIFRNIQWFDGKDKDEDGACVLVSGSRCLFQRCFFAGMGHATPAARAGSYSLKVTGEENCFDHCAIGLDTVKRTAANNELIVAGARNRFIKPEIRSWCETAGKFLMKLDNSSGDLRDTILEEPYFFNYTENWAAGVDNAIDMPAGGNTHFLNILGIPLLVGVNSTWADVVTRIYSSAPAPNAGLGLGTNPTS